MAIITKEIYLSIVEQSHHNLIPFSCVVESGINSNQTLDFEIESVANNFVFSKFIENVTSKNEDMDSDTYAPQEENQNIDHNNFMQVEIIAKDISGISEYNVRSEKEIYGYKKIETSFNIPKFSWSNDLFKNPEVESIEINNNQGSVWVGDANLNLRHMFYDENNNNSLSEIAKIELNSEPYKILFEKNKSKTLLTTYDNLIDMSIDDFWIQPTETEDGGLESQISTNLSIANDNRDIMSLINDNKLWTLQSYYGAVVERDPITLDILEQYDGFDAPHKIKWSKYHQAYFIAGTNILWQLKNGIKKAIYQITNYKLADFDVSPYGHICMIFDGDEDDIIRILKPNLYDFAMNEVISEGIARFCKYCDQGIFYILVELDSVLNYMFSSYIFDAKKNELNIFDESAEIAVTTTTTTAATMTNKVKVIYPSLDGYINNDSEIEILWQSTESATDNVKIELYKGGTLNLIITDKTINNGIYLWTVPADLESGTDYQIKITWIASTEFPNNSDIGSEFTVSSIITTTTTTTKSNFYSIGIDFNAKKRHVVNVLMNGLVGFVNLNDNLFYGLYQAEDSDLSDVICMAVREDFYSPISKISAIRVFVGSSEYLSDKWDSGIIETDKTSIYYGGGDNLIPGETYFVNIQVRDENGWSGVQTKEWIMPK